MISATRARTPYDAVPPRPASTTATQSAPAATTVDQTILGGGPGANLLPRPEACASAKSRRLGLCHGPCSQTWEGR